MKQHYYMTDDIDSVEHISADLHELNITDDHIHVVGMDIDAIEQHHIHLARAIDETDIVRSSERGTLLGIVMGILFVWGATTYQPFGFEFSTISLVMISMLIVGICAYWGGVFGTYFDNYRISGFHNAILAGKFLMMVDTRKDQESPLRNMMRKRHPEASWMGKDSTIANPFHA